MTTDKKLSDLTEDTTPTSDDLLLITDTGTTTSKKATITNVLAVRTDQDVKTTSSPTFAGLGLNGDADLNDNDIKEIKTAGFNDVNVSGSKTASFNVNFDITQSESVTLTANTMTATLQTPLQSDATRTLYVTNGGLATLTWAAASGSIYWSVGVVPSLTSSGIDVIVFKWDGTNWYGMASYDFS